MGTTESPWAIDPGNWVEAAPFRAHLRHLMETTGRTWQEIAEVAKISRPDAHRLLYGRRGRAVRKVSPQTASRLFWLSRGQLVESAHSAWASGGSGAHGGRADAPATRPAA